MTARPHAKIENLVTINCEFSLPRLLPHTDLGVPFFQFSSFSCAIIPGDCSGSTVGILVVVPHFVEVVYTLLLSGTSALSPSHHTIELYLLNSVHTAQYLSIRTVPAVLALC